VLAVRKGGTRPLKKSIKIFRQKNAAVPFPAGAMSRALRTVKPVNYGENVGGRTPAWMRKSSAAGGEERGAGDSEGEGADASPLRMRPLVEPLRADKVAAAKKAAPPAGGAGGGAGGAGAGKENGADAWGYRTPSDGNGGSPSPPRAAKPAAGAKKKLARKGKPGVAAATLKGLAAAAKAAKAGLKRPPPRAASPADDSEEGSEEEEEEVVPPPRKHAPDAAAKRPRTEQARAFFFVVHASKLCICIPGRRRRAAPGRGSPHAEPPAC
jgi:hypothetical protein